MTSIRLLFLLVCFAALADGYTDRVAAQTTRRLALMGATVIDGTGGPGLPDAVILIEDGRIHTVGSRSQIAIPDDFERMNLAGLTLLPGLIDSHVQMGAVFGVALVVVIVGNAFGPTAMDAFRIHFRVLIAGGLATALLSLPIDTRPGREPADARPQPLTVAGAEERRLRSV